MKNWKNWEPYKKVDFGWLWDIGWILGLKLFEFFFYGLIPGFFLDVFKLRWCIFQGTSVGLRQANFNDFRAGKPRPAPVFAANRYPYQLPTRWDSCLVHTYTELRLMYINPILQIPIIPYKEIQARKIMALYIYIYRSLYIYTYSKSLWCIANI